MGLRSLNLNDGIGIRVIGVWYFGGVLGGINS